MQRKHLASEHKKPKEAPDVMSISIDTNEGRIVIVNAYIPSGVDAMTEEERDLIMDIHLAISAHITEQEAAHAAITMDANETITPRGRMRILQGQSIPTTYIWPRWESWTTS